MARKNTSGSKDSGAKRKAAGVDIGTDDRSSKAKKNAAGTKIKEPLSVIREAGTEGATVHPFNTDPADHCETPREAYEHVAPFLSKLAQHLRKDPSDLLIYDPYFCEGSMKKHLGKLGFNNVYNKNEDFYQVIADVEVPKYDILITSPPYSRDHMQKLAHFCAASAKPWALLLPSFVHRKEYWRQSFPDESDMAWVVPEKRYHYWSICGGRKHNVQVCRHWTRDGHCKYGSGCAFLHPKDSSDLGAGLVKPPADVNAGEVAQQHVDPHLLSPYNSLWHVQVPQAARQGATAKWQTKGAELAKTRAELERILDSAKGQQIKLSTGGLTTPDESSRMSLEEARAAERLRVRRKKEATKAEAERKARAAQARQLETGL